MQKLTLTKVYRAKAKKDGTPYPYPRCSILAEEYGEQWLSGKWDETTDSWKEGDVVEVDVQRKGDFLNFYVKESPANNRLNELEARLVRVETQLANFKSDLEAKFAQLKIDLTLEMTGKFQTTKDYEKNNIEMDNLVSDMREKKQELPPNNPPETGINPDDIPF